MPQDDDSEDDPAQGFPLYCCGGLSQARFLFRVPPPQDLLHAFQEPHPPQFPCTTNNTYIDSNFMLCLNTG